MAEVKKGIVEKVFCWAMTSPLALRSIQQDCEAQRSDSEECTAV